jgi:energy-coupling factor transporter ATP-binding protein EcfA2
LVTNFKGIGSQPADLSLRSITLLFGANSAGKSTILQALHYLREVIERRNPDPDQTILGGASLDLGGFQNIVHRHESDRHITVGVDATIGDDSLPWADRMLDHWTAEVYGQDALNVSGLIDIESVGIRVSTAWDPVGNQAWITSYTVRINEEDVASITREGPKESPEIDDVNWEHPLFLALRLLPSVIEDEPEDDAPVNARGIPVSASWINGGYEPDDFLGGLRHDIFQQLDYSGRHRGTLFGMTSVIPSFTDILPHEPQVQIGEVILNGYSMSDSDGRDETVVAITRSVFSQCFVGIGSLILEELQGMRYIGPIRELPDRDHRAPRIDDPGRWANGLAAWDLLLSHYDPETGTGDEFVHEVSNYLADEEKLGLNYRIDVSGSRLLDDSSTAMLGLRRVLRDYEDLDAEDFRRLVWEPLQDLSLRPRLVIKSVLPPVDLGAQDIGVGVSQVVPVVVAALAQGAKLISVEQPELHLHPAAQVRLGDLLIERANTGHRQFLLETHSEHLILRLLRRIRETSEGDLDDRPDLHLTPDDVGIFWVENDAQEGLQITPLPVDETGEFIRAWPHGFFEERREELFG